MSTVDVGNGVADEKAERLGDASRIARRRSGLPERAISAIARLMLACTLSPSHRRGFPSVARGWCPEPFDSRTPRVALALTKAVADLKLTNADVDGVKNLKTGIGAVLRIKSDWQREFDPRNSALAQGLFR
jgi:hypothetical protein